jgi:hypothetical protein
MQKLPSQETMRVINSAIAKVTSKVDPKPIAEVLKGVQVGTVAMIASAFTRDGLTPAESTRKAFELLEYAAAGREGISEVVLGGYTESLLAFEKANGASSEESLDLVPNPLYDDFLKKVNASGMIENRADEELLPFKKALERLMPQKIKAAQREGRFKEWCSQCRQMKKPNMPALRNKGIPVSLYREVKGIAANWSAEVSKKRSEAAVKKSSSKK